MARLSKKRMLAAATACIRQRHDVISGARNNTKVVSNPEQLLRQSLSVLLKTSESSLNGYVKSGGWLVSLAMMMSGLFAIAVPITIPCLTTRELMWEGIRLIFWIHVQLDEGLIQQLANVCSCEDYG